MIEAIKDAPICKMIVEGLSGKWHYDKVGGIDYERVKKIIYD